MNVVELNNVDQMYAGGVLALSDVNVSIEAGQVVGLVGENGAGKTTLMRIAMGMLGPRRGTVRLFGLDPRRDAVGVKRRIGYVSEDQILPPFLRVDRVIDLHRSLFPTWDDALARRLAERFKISPKAKIRTLSKGQARQVALLCAVAHRPELLLLDEPAGGLDPAARREFLETSIRLLNEAGTAILFSSHYLTDVERMADRLVMLHDGRVLIDSDLDTLRESYSLALLPANGTVSRDRLLALGGCLGVRERSEGLRALFALAPGETSELLAETVGIGDAPCHRIGLEEMFIELVGGQA